MARKTVITVGLPDDVLRALKTAQHRMYCQAVGAEVSGAGYSRALTVEILLRESLERRGLLERQAHQVNNDGTADNADNACPENE